MILAGICILPYGLTNLSLKFDNKGNLLGTFGTGYNSNPESIAIDVEGNVYVGQADGTGDILKFDSSGNLLKEFDVATENRGSDWIDLAADQCTIYYTSEGDSIKRYDVCKDIQLRILLLTLHIIILVRRTRYVFFRLERVYSS